MRQGARSLPVGSFTWHPRIYKSWTADQEHAASVLQRVRSLSTAEKIAIGQWLRKGSDWGLNAVCKGVHDGPETVVEIYGPLELVPIAIIYPDGDRGFLLEEFNGRIRETPSIDAALALVLQ